MNTWQEAIKYLESSIQSWTGLRKHTSSIAGNLSQDISDSEKTKIQWEVDALSFQFHNGELKSIFSQPSEDGKSVIAYPDLARFSPEAFEYFNIRAHETISPFLKGRYFAILWYAPKPFRMITNGEKAINTLLNILDANQPAVKNDWLEPLGIFKVASRISAQINNYRSNDLIELSRAWLKQSFQDDKYFKVALIRFIIELPKIWKPSNLQFEHDLLFEIMNEFLGEPDSFSGKEAGLLGVQLANKLGLDTKIWKNKIGEIFEAFAQHRLDDDTRMVPLGQLQEAMNFYKQAGNQAKLNAVGKQYQHLKGELKLKEVKIPLNSKTTEWLWNFNQKLAEKLTDQEPTVVFDFLAINKEVFPRAAYFKELDKNRQPSFFDFVKKMKFDVNKNLGSLNAEKQKDGLVDEYRFYIEFQVLPLLAMIFTKGILKGKINFDTLIQYLSEKSWLGQELEETSSVGDSRKYYWLGLLAPAFLEFFAQKEADLQSQNIYTNYVLCIDSLTLKFEGILRDFAKRLNANTIKTGREGQIREGFTEDLLELEEIKSMFSEDDLLFFKYVFTASGINLRNNIAHCFFRFSDYHEAHVFLVLAAILRFAKYRVDPNIANS